MPKKVAISTPIFKHPIDRYPRLDTVLMIEKAIQESGGDYTVRKLWQQLPKKVMWQTYLTVLDYLEHQGHIMFSEQNHVFWTKMSPQMLERYQKGLMPQVR